MNKKDLFYCSTCNKKIGINKKDNHLKKHRNLDEKHIAHEEDSDYFKTYFWKLILAIVLLIPTLMDIFISTTTTNSFLLFISNDWFLFATSTITFIVFGYDYFLSSYKVLKQKQLSVNLLVSISILASYLFSIVILITIGANQGGNELLFGATIEVATIIYFGKYLEDYLSNTIVKDLNKTLKLYSKDVILFINDKELTIRPEEINVDDILVVYPGEKIPTDGKIWNGISEINEATFTGESIPVVKREGDFVFGGTISNKKIYVTVTKKIEDSILSKIIDQINEAKSSKPKTQKIADKIATYLIPTVLLIGIISFTIHISLSGDTYNAFKVLVTILVISCPCSFSLITPLSILVANGESAKKYIILNSKDVFEEISSIDTVIFDKTGTLTKGNIIVKESTIDEKYLPILITAEFNYNHPISNSILKHFSTIKKIDNVTYEEITGKGLRVEYEGEIYHVGSHNYLKETIPNFKEDQELENKKLEGKLIVYFFTKKELLGHIILEDEIKSEAKELIRKLNNEKIEVFMITGDNKLTANYVGNEIGLKQENIFSEVLPSDKYKIVKQMQEQGKKVVFVGDGINDSIALQQSNLGISMGSANDISIESSDITIQNNNLANVLLSINISKSTVHTIYFGFGIAILYNIIFIPIAAVGLIPPVLAATVMALNDVVAIFIAASLKRIKFFKT